ncbi:hypothetical protein [Sphingopyxis sp.]|jgi:hypothetical protein|uniref:hypothetical protein n=1 Tax=Sphingopyxis sp. TaxID=1908224 RepID=UPI003F72EDC5
MIDRITVKKKGKNGIVATTRIDLVRDRDQRRGLANAIKGALFGGKSTFRRNHDRGAAALAAARA